MSDHMGGDANAGVEQIKNEIRSLIAEIVEVPEEAITDSVTFRELGADSLMALEIVANIEKKFRIHVPEEELERVKSFGDTIALVREYLARAGG